MRAAWIWDYPKADKSGAGMGCRLNLPTTSARIDWVGQPSGMAVFDSARWVGTACDFVCRPGRRLCRTSTQGREGRPGINLVSRGSCLLEHCGNLRLDDVPVRIVIWLPTQKSRPLAGPAFLNLFRERPVILKSGWLPSAPCRHRSCQWSSARGPRASRRSTC